nr:unnamed protein product [Callosobruchus chinensis]
MVKKLAVAHWPQELK